MVRSKRRRKRISPHYWIGSWRPPIGCCMTTESNGKSGDRNPQLHRAVAALQQMRAKLVAAERRRNEPIAIIGLWCRFPRAGSPEAFWDLLRRGEDAVTEIPADRWDVNAYYDPDPDCPGRAYTRHGAFLSDVDCFDAGFFGIAPREAQSLDPQQRILLEVVWHALENAGIAASEVPGARTGVFVGITSSDYSRLLDTHDTTAIDPYIFSGNALNFAAGRISHTFNLRGPSLAIDTACSSSLVAVHLACASLRAGECNLALAGGVNLILAPEGMIWGSKLRALAPDGRSKAFDASGDGFGRGDGCGIVVLKRLSDALADDDQVCALIRGSAVNHDGASSGLTVPNGPAQEEVIRKALANARIVPGNVGYVECHGTGTALGDPIEIRALGNVLKENRAADQPLFIGSVKSQIGHLEAAAGIAGLIKTSLVLQHAEIPGQRHLKQLNPLLPLDDIPAVVPTKQSAWPGSESRIAAVSSFGLSGTNAHAVLEAAPAVARASGDEIGERAQVLPISARSAGALQQFAAAYEAQLGEGPADAREICYTAATRRTHHHQYRIAAVGGTAAELAIELAARNTAAMQPLSSAESPEVVFVFPDEDGDCRETARQLLAAEPAFRAAMDRCSDAFSPYLGRSVREELEATVSAEPAPSALLFAVQVALAALWRDWGVEPGATVGFGVGEIAGAYIAGILDVSEAARIIANSDNLRVADILQGREASIRVYSAGEGLRAAVERITRDGYSVYLEMSGWSGGPSRIRSAIASALHGGQTPLLLPRQLANAPDDRRSMLLRSVAALYERGQRIAWDRLHPTGGRRVKLPGYPWQRERFWPEQRERGRARNIQSHPLLTRHFHPPLERDTHIWEADVNTGRLPHLLDHRIAGAVIVPAAVYLETAIAAASEIFDGEPLGLTDVVLARALLVPIGGSRVLRLTIRRMASAVSFQFASVAGEATEQTNQDANLDSTWTVHVEGKISLDRQSSELTALNLDHIYARCADNVPGAAYYETLDARGVECRNSFQSLKRISRRDGEALAAMAPGISQQLTSSGYRTSPAMLDGCFQTLAAALRSADWQSGAGGIDPWVPVRLGSLRFLAEPQPEVFSYAVLTNVAEAPSASSGAL